MLGRVRLWTASNGRVAWMMAGGALAAIVTLPTPVSAQVDVPTKPQGYAPSRSAPGGSQNTQVVRPTRDRADLLDLRDAATANTMVVAPAPAPAGAEPLTVNAVVCLAGCDHGPGTVVYRDRPMPTLASLTEPVPAAPVKPSLVSASAAVQVPGSPLTCLAGCYEPPVRRTVASLRSQVAKAATQPSARAPRTIVVAPAVAALDDAPTQSDVAPTPSTAQPTKLRSAFATDGTRKSARVTTAKSRARAVAKRTPLYGKVVPVPTDKRAAVSEPTAVVEAPSEKPAPAATPVATFSPARKTEKRQPEKARPHASVSNDWFNQINRQRKKDEAQQQDQ